MIIGQSEHWDDEQLGKGEPITRTISNFLNYQTRDGLYLKSDNTVAPIVSPVGQLEHTCPIACKTSALQSYFGSLAGAPSIVGLASSKFEGEVRLIPINTNTATLKTDSRTFIERLPWIGKDQTVFNEAFWKDLWDETDLWYETGRAKLKETICLKGRGHPYSFTFAVDAQGLEFRFKDFEGIILGPDGNPVMKLLPVTAFDSSGKDELSNLQIKCWMEAGPSVYVLGRWLPSVVISIDPAECATATYPIYIDPTTTISGTAALQDNVMFGNNVTFNAGARTNLITYFAGGVPAYNSVIRVATASIPGGTLTGAHLIANHYANEGAFEVYVVKDANAWVEGTQTYAAEVGSSCWSRTIYDTVSWAGSSGCNTSGTDYDADAAPPTYGPVLGGVAVWTNISLLTAWFAAWKAGTRVNNGFLLRAKIGGVQARCDLYSTESGTNPLYVTIDYIVPGTILYWKIP